MTNKIPILLLIGLSVFWVIVGAWWFIDDEPFKTYRSEINVFGDENYGHIKWLDNNTVVFQGIEREKAIEAIQDWRNPDKVRNWNYWAWTPGTPERRIQIPPEGQPENMLLGWYFCLWNGEFSYPIANEEERKEWGHRWARGLLKNDRLQNLEVNRSHTRGEFYTERNRQSDCRAIRQEKYRNWYWRPLPDDRGVIELGPAPIVGVMREPEARALWFPKLILNDGSPEVPIPMPIKDVSVTTGFYVRYFDAFLFYASRFKKPVWKEPGCDPYWLVFLDGRYQRHCLPHGPWHQADRSIAVTQKGLFVGTKGYDTYLIPNDGREAIKVLDGVGTHAVTSPDGCKVAFKHGWNWWRFIKHRDENRVVIIDFCSE